MTYTVQLINGSLRTVVGVSRGYIQDGVLNLQYRKDGRLLAISFPLRNILSYETFAGLQDSD